MKKNLVVLATALTVLGGVRQPRRRIRTWSQYATTTQSFGHVGLSLAVANSLAHHICPVTLNLSSLLTEVRSVHILRFSILSPNGGIIRL